MPGVLPTSAPPASVCLRAWDLQPLSPHRTHLGHRARRQPLPAALVIPNFLGRFFIGTSVSTFSFRIHEEREILGLDPRTTYNRFCGDQEEACEQPTHWRVAY